jgi:hypothetical protein
MVLAAFSVYLVCRKKNLNKQVIRFWFVANLVVGSIFVGILTLLEILPAYLYQAIVWPLTEFSHPPLNLSWWFSFVWFPLSILLLLAMTYSGFAVLKSEQVHFRLLFVVMVFLTFSLFHLTSRIEFSGSNTNTLRTLPGLLKNAAMYFEFIVCYSSAMVFLAGITFNSVLLWRNPKFGISKFFKPEHFMVMTMGLTGIFQLYPLKDNVHLWFASPLLIVSATYYLKLVLWDKSLFTRSLAVILSCLVIVQCIVLFRFALVDREPLSSYSLRGLISNSEFQLGIGKSMQLLDENLSGRVLRNNCVDSLFSVAKGKYVSIDGNFSSNSFGNFTDTVPVVDPSPLQPDYFFECRISNFRIQELVREGAIIVFQFPRAVDAGKSKGDYDVLFQKKIM